MSKILKAAFDGLAKNIRDNAGALKDLTFADATTSKTAVKTQDLRCQVLARSGVAKKRRSNVVLSHCYHGGLFYLEAIVAQVGRKVNCAAKLHVTCASMCIEIPQDPSMATAIVQANSEATDRTVKDFIKKKTGGHKWTHQAIGEKIKFELGDKFNVEDVAKGVEKNK